MDQVVRTDPRTHYEAVFDVGYGVNINRMNARAHRRLAHILSGGQVLAGTAAFTTVVANVPGAVPYLGLAVAALSVLGHFMAPAEKAVQFAELQRRFTRLQGRAAKLGIDAIDREIAEIRADAPDGIDALDVPAYNCTAQQIGRPDAQLRVHVGHRLASLLA